MKTCYTFLWVATFLISAKSQTPTWSWAKKLTGPFFDYPYDIAKDADGDIYITGKFNSWIYDGTDTLFSYANVDGCLYKTDQNGNIKKKLKIGSKQSFSSAEESVSCVAVDAQKNIYIAGNYNTDSLFIGDSVLRKLPGNFGYNNNVFIAKLDSNFQTLWAKPIKCLSVDFPAKLEVDGEGNLYLTGKFAILTTIDKDTVYGVGTSGKMTVIKFNPQGNVIWSRNFGNSSEDQITDIAFDDNNDVYLSGVFTFQGKFDNNVTLIPPNTNEDACVVKLSKANGSVIWLKHITGIGRNFANSIEVNSSNEVYVGGYFGANSNYKKAALKIDADSVVAASADYEDIFVAKFDSAGNVKWIKRFGGTSNEYLYAMRLDESDKLFFAGYFSNSAVIGNNSFSGTGDVLVASLDSLGNLLWVGKGGGPKSADRPSDILPLNNDKILVTGIYNEVTLFGAHSLTANTTYGNGQTDVYLASISAPIISSTKEFSSNEHSFVIFPNPVSTQISVLSSNPVSSVKIFDVNGKMVLSDFSNTQSGYDVSALPQGLYVIEVESNGSLARKKFLKE